MAEALLAAALQGTLASVFSAALHPVRAASRCLEWLMSDEPGRVVSIEAPTANSPMLRCRCLYQAWPLSRLLTLTKASCWGPRASVSGHDR
jgi:hypothetical protein